MRVGFIGRSAIVCLLTGVAAFAAPTGTRSRPTPRAARAVDLGATSSSKVVTITAWLRMHQGSALEQTVQSQQDPASAGFEKWSDDSALDAAYAPTAAEVATVRSYLAASGLTVTGVGPHNLFVSARGTAAQVQAALGVELHDFRRAGSTYSASTAKPSLPSNLQSVVAFVGGLNEVRPQPMNARPFDPDGNFTRRALTARPGGLFFSASCFRPTETVHFSSADADATYRATATVRTSRTPTSAPCHLAVTSRATSRPRTTWTSSTGPAWTGGDRPSRSWTRSDRPPSSRTSPRFRRPWACRPPA